MITPFISEITSLPGGEVLYIHPVYISVLYNQGLILYRLDLGWTYNDEDEHRIKKILRHKDICLL